MSETVVAKTQQGQLLGKKVKSAAGGEYYSFQGIPYAKPPLGQLRFRPPQPAESWEGIRDATKERDVSPCIQNGLFIGNEDCLFINVYNSEWPVKSMKPVMFWIHGGGFVFGSGNTDFFGPDFLVAEDIVLVTINYRLGALGFLNLGGSDVSDNNGLRDQVMALTWVKQNIAVFGGDPGNVTIFGTSVGGVSVSCLMLSHLAEGLFHRAIAMSGTSLLPECFTPCDVIHERSVRLAELLGCTSQDPQQVADFLRNAPAEEIVKNQRLAVSDMVRSRILTFSFTYTYRPSDDQFFPDHPFILLEQGKFSHVPCIIGVTSGEGRIALHSCDMEYLSISDVGKNMELVVPVDLSIKLGTQRSRKIAERLKNFYYGDLPVDESSIVQFVEMGSDILFVYPVFTTLRLLLRSSDKPLYVYLLEHETPWDLLLLSDVILTSVPGSSHGEDISYLFFTRIKPNVYPSESAEAIVRSHMIKYWTHFAKTGVLSQVTNKMSWPTATKEKFQFLRISKELKVDTNFYEKRIKFLDGLYGTFKRE